LTSNFIPLVPSRTDNGQSKTFTNALMYWKT